MAPRALGGAMCEGYWDRRTQRWVSLEELEAQDEDLETLLNAEIKLAPPVLDPKRKPAMLAR